MAIQYNWPSVRCHHCSAATVTYPEPCTGHTIESFAEFFAKKIDDVRSATAVLPPLPMPVHAPSSFILFQPVWRAAYHYELAVKSCPLDPVPTFFVREFVGLLSLAMPDKYGQRIACSRSTIAVTEACNSDNCLEDAMARFIWCG